MAIVIGGVVRQCSESKGVVVYVLRIVDHGTDKISATDIMGEIAEEVASVRVVAHVLNDRPAIGECLRGIQLFVGCLRISLVERGAQIGVPDGVDDCLVR